MKVVQENHFWKKNLLKKTVFFYQIDLHKKLVVNSAKKFVRQNKFWLLGYMDTPLFPCLLPTFQTACLCVCLLSYQTAGEPVNMPNNMRTHLLSCFSTHTHLSEIWVGTGAELGNFNSKCTWVDLFFNKISLGIACSFFHVWLMIILSPELLERNP